jgi:uncharacterized repeat protein (TIGR03803 family)
MIDGAVQVTGFVGPTFSGDTYPTHDAQYGRDGLRNVPTITERNLIPYDRRVVMMVVGTQDDGLYWKLDNNPSGDTTINSDWSIFQTGGGGGSFTGNTSATCITDLYVTNMHGCSPITLHDGFKTVNSIISGTLSKADGRETKTGYVVNTIPINGIYYSASTSTIYLPYGLDPMFSANLNFYLYNGLPITFYHGEQNFTYYSVVSSHNTVYGLSVPDNFIQAGVAFDLQAGDAEARCFYEFNGELYLGGYLPISVSGSTNNIVKWNAGAWDQVGLGVNSTVLTITEFNNELYIGGWFSFDGNGNTLNYVAKWDGTAWVQVGNGLNNAVASLVEYDGDLYAGGWFNFDGDNTNPLNYIAKWDGSAWVQVDNGVNSSVMSLFVFNNELYIGGWFNMDGSNINPLNYIAKWDGTAWIQADNGVNNGVYTMASFNNELHIAGNFWADGYTNPLNYFAKWDGTAWVQVGDGFNNQVSKLQVINNELYIGGSFNQDSVGNPLNYIAKWDGAVLSQIHGGVSDSVYDMWFYDNKLFICGYFNNSGYGNEVLLVGQENVFTEALATSITLTEDISDGIDDIIGGYIAIGGDYTHTEGDKTIAFGKFGHGEGCENIITGIGGHGEGRLNQIKSNNSHGEGLSTKNNIEHTVPLVLGVNGSYYDSQTSTFYVATSDASIFNDVFELTLNHGTTHEFYPHQTVTNIYPVYENIPSSGFTEVGGFFQGEGLAFLNTGSSLILGGNLPLDKTGLIPKYNVFILDSVSKNIWFDLGNGFNKAVTSLVLLNGEIYAGGGFDSDGIGNIIRMVGKWDGATWTQVGNGLGDVVQTLVIHNGELYAGGNFLSDGDGNHLNYIAKWDGTTWTQVGNGFNGSVRTLFSFNGDLYAGGDFDTDGPGSIWLGYIAKWDGTAWGPLSVGFNTSVITINQFNNELYIGGAFTSDDNGDPLPYIAKYDSGADTFLPVGFGFNANVSTLHVFNNELYAGGGFEFDGDGNPIAFIAKWNGSAWVQVNDGFDGKVLVISDFQNQLYVGGSFSADGLGTPMLRVARDTAEQNLLHFAIVLSEDLSGGVKDVDGGFVTFGGEYSHTEGYKSETNGVGSHAEGELTTTYGKFSHTEGTQTTTNEAYSHTEGDQTVTNGIGSHAEGLKTKTGFELPTIQHNGVYYLANPPELYISGDYTQYLYNLGTITFYNGSTEQEYFEISLSSSSYNQTYGLYPVYHGLDGYHVEGVIGEVMAIIEFEGDLIVGGCFKSDADNLIALNSIGRWNGTSWLKMDEGLGDGDFINIVHTLTIFNGELYAGGTFKYTGLGEVVNFVAKWNGTKWVSMSAGFNAPVYSLAVHNNVLYAGGKFSRRASDNATMRYIAAWDGHEWQNCSAESMLNNSVRSILSFNGTLYIGGEFTQAGKMPARYIARWNGYWEELAKGLNAPVFALAEHNNELYIGGFFQADNNIGYPLNGIGKWDGSNITPLFQGFNDKVFSVADVNGVLQVGGSFNADAGYGDPMMGIAKWDGSSWSQVDIGLKGIVFAINTTAGVGTYGGNFIVGNDIDRQFNYLARFQTIDNYTVVTLGSDPTYGINDTVGGYIIFGGHYSHSEGEETIAGGNSCHSEGLLSLSIGYGSHAEGRATATIGEFSHTEGSGTTTFTRFGHAEGRDTVVSGESSHAQGRETYVFGENSNVSGYQNALYGNNSAIVAGQGILGIADNTAYVPNLNLAYTPDVDASIGDVLVRAADGTVKTRSADTIGSFTGNTIDTCIADLYVHNLGGCSPVNIITDVNIHGSLIPVPPVFPTVFSSIYGFTSTADGSQPYGGLVEYEGNFYGVTTYGGTNSYGTLYKYDPISGIKTTLFNFDITYGAYPAAVPIVYNGKLYGTAAQGGASYSYGAIYVYDLNTSTMSLLYSFDYWTGYRPNASPVIYNNKLYCTTQNGGAVGYGVIVEYDLNTSTFTLLHSFNYADGSYAYSDLIVYNGKLFGTTNQGSYGYGTIFSYDLNTSTLSTLHSFTYFDGVYPMGGLVLGSDNMLYGATTSSALNGYGSFFKFNPNTSVFTLLVDFDYNTTGAYAYKSPMHYNGKIYGTLGGGGTGVNQSGVIYSYDIDTSVYTVLHNFDGATATDLSTPDGAPMVYNGLFYGVTHFGGVAGIGAIFEFNPEHNGINNIGSSTEPFDEIYTTNLDVSNDITLHGSLLTTEVFIPSSGVEILNSFTSYNLTGWSPQGITIHENKIYGTDLYTVPMAAGALYTANTDGSGYSVIIPFDWTGVGQLAKPVIYENRIYGVTENGSVTHGRIYTANTNGSGYDIIHNFNGTEGSQSRSEVVIEDNKLFGATRFGGVNNEGVLYSANTDGSNFNVLHSFSAISGGTAITAPVFNNGILYGAIFGGPANYGVIYKFDLLSSLYTPIHFFNDTDGAYPYSSPIIYNDSLYGTTYLGGSGAGGVVYKLDLTTDIFEVLYNFDLNVDGSQSQSPPFIYGNKIYVTVAGGGTAFGALLGRMNLDGSNYEHLHSFDTTLEGNSPINSLCTDGLKLYGICNQGGGNAGGTLFSYGLESISPSISNIGTSDIPFAHIYTQNLSIQNLSTGTSVNTLGVDVDGNVILVATPDYASFIFTGNTSATCINEIYVHNLGGCSPINVLTDINLEANLIPVSTAMSEAYYEKIYDQAIATGYSFVTVPILYNGKLYGAGGSGGDFGGTNGVLYTVNTDGSNYTITHSFSGTGGYHPPDVPIIYNDILIGTTMAGGEDSSQGGVIYTANTDGSNYAVVHSFTEYTGDIPYTSPMIYNGILLGLTSYGGSTFLSGGVLYSANTDGSNYTILYNFDHTGKTPHSNPTLYNGVLIGATYDGGVGQGTIYSINPDGTNFTNLHSFDWLNDGAQPPCSPIIYNNILIGAAGNGGGFNIYDGTLYTANTDGSNFKVIHLFDGPNGSSPNAIVMRNDILYGVTRLGGLNSVGVIFSINPDGSNYTVLHHFENTTGAMGGDLSQFDDFTLMGITSWGGVNNRGVIFNYNLEQPINNNSIGLSGSPFNHVYTQNLTIQTDYVPISPTDPYGTIGQIVWDDSFIYVKTNVGWSRTSLANVWP